MPEFLDEIGYGPQHGDRITSITSAIGDEPAIWGANASSAQVVPMVRELSIADFGEHAVQVADDGSFTPR